MKKLSLVLALIFVLTCVLVSCGGETENSSSVESSKAESAQSNQSTESSEESIESSEEPADPFAEAVDPIELTGEVISLGCQYEVPGGKGYVVVDDKWPANYTADLTDGIANDKLTYDSSWFSFNSAPDADGEANTINNVGTAIIDLGEIKSVTGVRTNIFKGDAAASIASIGSVVVSVSEDGKTFSAPFKLNIPTEPVAWAEGGCAAVNARYVKVQFIKDGEGFHMFTNEIEVYGN